LEATTVCSVPPTVLVSVGIDLHRIGREKLGDLRALLLGHHLHQRLLDLAAGLLVGHLKDGIHPVGQALGRAVEGDHRHIAGHHLEIVGRDLGAGQRERGAQGRDQHDLAVLVAG
jgi:hypothetical protein